MWKMEILERKYIFWSSYFVNDSIHYSNGIIISAASASDLLPIDQSMITVLSAKSVCVVLESKICY